MAVIAPELMSLARIHPGVYVLERGGLYRIECSVKGQVRLESVVGERDAAGDYPKRWASEGRVLGMQFIYAGDA